MEKPSSSGQQGQFLHRFFNRVDCDYTSHYCEENIWRLCDAIRKHQPEQLQYARVVFISNDIKQMPLWRQKIAPSVNECVFWDYHVILLITAQDRGQTIVYDFDTTLPFPVPVDEYWQLTFRPNSFNFPDDYRRKFRVISADEFLQRFSSDRRHMKAANGDWLAPPPGWSCIYSQDFGHSLAQFIDMREEFYGRGSLIKGDESAGDEYGKKRKNAVADRRLRVSQSAGLIAAGGETATAHLHRDPNRISSLPDPGEEADNQSNSGAMTRPLSTTTAIDTNDNDDDDDDPLTGPGWLTRGDRMPLENRIPFNRPSIRQVVKAIPFVVRYFVYWLRHWRKKEALFINTFQPLQHKPHYGVPCGGIGSGSIGRDFRGGFCKFGLRPGLVEHHVDVLRADQFIVTLRRLPECNPSIIYQKVLCAVPFPADQEASRELSEWDFNFPATNITYRGLYPRSWTRFDITEHNIKILCRQISPVIPHDYKASSLPVAVFVFDVQNNSEFDYDVSITFTFRNGTGHKKWRNEGSCKTTRFDQQPTFLDASKVAGVSLEHTISGMPCTYAIGASNKLGQCISVCRRFNPCRSGFYFWQNLQHTGTVLDEADEATVNEQGVAVCVKSRVACGCVGRSMNAPVEFALAWDMPIVKFGSSERRYKRRYTRFFTANGGDTGARLCAYALKNYRDWEQRIETWQNPVLKHPHLPEWYKSALYNELYFITDGGSLWFEYDANWTKEESHLSSYSRNLMKEYGRFGYLESWEYRMVNTYDVHFYASFALAQLWPSLEHTVQAEFTDQIAHSNDESITYHMEGDRAPNKLRNRVPHDLGNPAADPWLRTNAYVMHDTGKWKDLNLKFVLTSYRDWIRLLGKDRKFLEFVWPAIANLLDEALEHWDRDGDGMIENFGKADQTYDAWKMGGVSAYCGSLWLAALRVAIIMAESMDDSKNEQRYSEVLQKARIVFVKKLWNGSYYNFDEESLSQRTIMADQLCGYWFLHSVDPAAAKNLLPEDQVDSALMTIFKFNVQKFANGRLGAVNGMQPNGLVDHNYIQADEMWTGVTYALGAFLIQKGKLQEGFDTAWGSYDACFNRLGLQYQTPEALYEHKFYRAIGYMRPLSIWAMQWALERHCGAFEERELDEKLKHLRTGSPPPIADLLTPLALIKGLIEEQEAIMEPMKMEDDNVSVTPSTSGCSSGCSRSLSDQK